MAEIFQNLLINFNLHIKEAQHAPSKINTKRYIYGHIITKMLKEKEKYLENRERKTTCHVLGNTNMTFQKNFIIFWPHHAARGIFIPLTRDQTRTPCSGSAES